MNYKRIVEIDYLFWIEFIIRTYFVPVIAFLVTCGLYTLDFSRACRKSFNQWHHDWVTPENTEPKTYDYQL